MVEHLRERLDGIGVPTPPPGSVGTKDDRSYFSYSLDQYLYRSKEHPEEGVGLFGQLRSRTGTSSRCSSSGAKVPMAVRGRNE